MNIAFVYDRLNKFGGAERVLLALHEIWPHAPLYTAVYDPDRARWASVFQVHTSFLQHVPFAKTHHEWFAWATPMAFESLSFDQYDVVISVTSAEAKDIITKPHTLHICYCLTPTRYLWSGFKMYERGRSTGAPGSVSSTLFRRLAPRLQAWDIYGSTRPDAYIAISHLVAKRIEKYYHRSAERVIYPPVDVDRFKINDQRLKGKDQEDYFLVVSRLVDYKRVDIVIEACNRLNLPLVVIGEGWEKPRLMRMANRTVRFVGGNLTDEELVDYYQHCRAFIVAAEEDFGIVAVEAQGCGKPVIAYKRSGISEIVVEGKTGQLFEEQTVDSLVLALKRFDSKWYDSGFTRRNSLRFSKDRFIREMRTIVTKLYTQKKL